MAVCEGGERRFDVGSFSSKSLEPHAKPLLSYWVGHVIGQNIHDGRRNE